MSVPYDPEWLDAMISEVNYGYDGEEKIGGVRRERIRTAIDNMPAGMRDIINGVYYEGLSQQELCVRYGLTRSQVRHRLRMAHRYLNRLLAFRLAEPIEEDQ